MARRALLVVDLQNDYFPNGKWTLHDIEDVTENAARLIAVARETGDLLVHVRHEFTAADAPFFVAGTEGAAVHRKVGPAEGEEVFLKHHVNVFHDTRLKAILDMHDVKKLTVCGAMTHMCVDAAVRAAHDHGYSVTVVHDACAARALDFRGVTVPAEMVHAAFMSALEFAYATALSTDEYLDSTTATE